MRAEAEREILASREELWQYLSEPYHLSDWWPTVAVVRPDRRGFAEGARWEVVGPTRPTLFRKGGASGQAIVRRIEPYERVVWHLTAERLTVEVRLHASARDRTVATVGIEGPWRPEAFGRPRALPRAAVNRLYELVQTAATLVPRAAGT